MGSPPVAVRRGIRRVCLDRIGGLQDGFVVLDCWIMARQPPKQAGIGKIVMGREERLPVPRSYDFTLLLLGWKSYCYYPAVRVGVGARGCALVNTLSNKLVNTFTKNLYGPIVRHPSVGFLAVTQFEDFPDTIRLPGTSPAATGTRERKKN